MEDSGSVLSLPSGQGLPELGQFLTLGISLSRELVQPFFHRLMEGWHLDHLSHRLEVIAGYGGIVDTGIDQGRLQPLMAQQLLSNLCYKW